jgi:DNA-binding transcriptional LysR family regulator
MGIAMLPRSVLSTFPESKRLSVHKLPAGENRFEIVLIWRRGAGSSKVQALRELLAGKGRK